MAKDKELTEKESILMLAFGDTIKPSARRAVERLHELGIRTLMLTGDNLGSAQAVARQLGIDEFRARCFLATRLTLCSNCGLPAKWWPSSAMA